MKVIRRPQGWGLLTMRRSNKTLVICSWIISCHGKTWMFSYIECARLNKNTNWLNQKFYMYVPGLILQTSKEGWRRSSVCEYSDIVVGWQRHLGKGSALRCPIPRLVSEKNPMQHQQKIQPAPLFVYGEFVPAAAGWPANMRNNSWNTPSHDIIHKFKNNSMLWVV